MVCVSLHVLQRTLQPHPPPVAPAGLSWLFISAGPDAAHPLWGAAKQLDPITVFMSRIAGGALLAATIILFTLKASRQAQRPHAPPAHGRRV